MLRASDLFSEQQRRQIEQAVGDVESRTSCEVVPVVVTASGRYDRAEDLAGLWLAVLTGITIWLLFPQCASLTGAWDGLPVLGQVALYVVAVLAAFVVGAVVASRAGWLRRLFTPRRQMQDEVNMRARQVFFDSRVHHTAGGTGLLIFVSLFEHTAVILADQKVVECLGQAFLDETRDTLIAGFRAGTFSEAICLTIAKLGERLAQTLPRAQDDINELQDTLILLD